MIWLILAALTSAFAVAVGWPILRPVLHKTRQQSRDQLAQIFAREKAAVERDLANGTIDEITASDVLRELDRRTVSDLRAIERTLELRTRPHAFVAGAAVALVLFGSFGLYMVVGSPEMPQILQAHHKTLQEQQKLAIDVKQRESDLNSAIERIGAHLNRNPNDQQAKIMLARAYFVLGDVRSAYNVLTIAAEQHTNNANVRALLAEAIIVLADGIVTDEAADHIAAALIIDPNQDTALYYQGWIYLRDQNIPQLVKTWTRLLGIAPKNAPYVNDISRRLAAIKSASESHGNIAANLPPLAQSSGAIAPELSEDVVRDAMKMAADDRAAFIDSMVAKLADRLRDDPDDIDGWLRLGRAYEVLGRPADAILAYQSIITIQPNHPLAMARLSILIK